MTSDAFSSDTLKTILAEAQLPALPQSALRLLELSQNEENGIADFAVPLESDPGLASQVLRFVNSSYFGFSREIATIRLAIRMVGIRTIKNFALWSALFSSIPDPKCGTYNLRLAWSDSLMRAVFARAVAQSQNAPDVDEPFSAALLQDVAVPLLAKAMPKAYLELLSQAQRSGMRLSELEREAFGWTHADVAGMICRHWNFPDSLVEMVENHLNIARFSEVTCDQVGGAAVALSALLPPPGDRQWAERDLFQRHYHRLMPTTAPDLRPLFAEVDRQFADLSIALRLPAASQTLADRCRQLHAVV
jgi:HD-like signal output (HDOD) protein